MMSASDVPHTEGNPLRVCKRTSFQWGLEVYAPHITHSSLLAREHAIFAAMRASSSMSGSTGPFFAPSPFAGWFSLSPTTSFFEDAFLALTLLGSTVNLTASAAA